MNIYVFAYLGILISSLVLSSTKKGKPIVITFIAWIICLIIASLRAESVGVDTANYLYIFQLLKSNPHLTLHTLSIFSTIEPGYLNLARWVSFISPNQIVFFLIQYAIIYASLFRYIRKHSINIACSLLLFVALSFTSTLNVMRQYLMFSLALYSLDFFQNKQWLWGGLLFIYSYFIHRSAVLFLPIFFLYFIPHKSKYLTWWLIGSCIGGLICSIPAILYPLLNLIGYARYATDVRYVASDSNGIMAYVYLFICIASYIVYLFHRKPVDENYAFYFILSFVGSLFALLANQAEILARAGSIYIFFIFLLIPLVIEKNFTCRTRQLIYSMMYGLLLIATYISARGYTYISYFD